MADIIDKTANLPVDEEIGAKEVSTPPASIGEMDYTAKYADEFYEDYINSFEQRKSKKRLFRFFKRVFDIVTSALGLIILSPVFLGIAIAIKCDSKGPVIFRQDRVGKGGRLFVCLKFRSMRIDAPKNAPTSQLKDPEQYYTKVGKFLRKTSLDELPQLWCVFIGKMSLVGYRPLVPHEVKANAMRARLGVFSMRPGITGHAQVMGRDGVYYKNKAILDAYYVKHASPWFDLKILFQTVGVVASFFMGKD